MSSEGGSTVPVVDSSGDGNGLRPGLAASSALAFWAALALFLGIFVLNAWVVDDAYISFRTVDNLVKGHGLTWNPGERVQTYSHPMWLFLVALFYVFTGDVFYTSIALSGVLCVCAFLLVYWLCRRACTPQADGSPASDWRPALFVLFCCSSKAVMDYSSSGLENPLSYFLAVLFFAPLLFSRRSLDELSERELLRLFFIAALAFFNRVDSLLIYLPTLLVALVFLLRSRGWRALLPLVAATAPATLWILFSLFYYGSPLPNTALAKVINTGLPFADRATRGLAYLANSMQWDAPGHLALWLLMGIALWRRSTQLLLLVVGVMLYLHFVVISAAAATHLAGRFMALPLVLVLLGLSSSLRDASYSALVALSVGGALLFHPMSPLRMGSDLYGSIDVGGNQVDANYHVHREGAALLNFSSRRPLPDHDWYHAGEAFRERPERVSLGGPGGREAVGYFGFAAGPDKYIIDYLGLADPLLSRLPACNVWYSELWKSGHFYRVPPDGYVDSVRASQNLLSDPDLRELYDKVLTVARGPLFSAERLGEILRLNLGHYDELSAAYARRIEERFRDVDCARFIVSHAGVVPEGR